MSRVPCRDATGASYNTPADSIAMKKALAMSWSAALLGCAPSRRSESRTPVSTAATIDRVVFSSEASVLIPALRAGTSLQPEPKIAASHGTISATKSVQGCLGREAIFGRLGLVDKAFSAC